MGFKQEQFINIKLPSANEPRGAAPGPARPSRPSRQLSIYSPPPLRVPPHPKLLPYPSLLPSSAPQSLSGTPPPWSSRPPSLPGHPTCHPPSLPAGTSHLCPHWGTPHPTTPLGHPHPSPSRTPHPFPPGLPVPHPPPGTPHPSPSRSPHNTYQPPPSACRTPSFPQTGGTPHPSARRRSAPRAAEGAEPQHQAPRFWGPGGTWSRRGDAGWGGQAARVPTSRSQEAGTHPSWTYLEEPITHMNF